MNRSFGSSLAVAFVLSALAAACGGPDKPAMTGTDLATDASAPSTPAAPAAPVAPGSLPK